jgi:hypothetical protein
LMNMVRGGPGGRFRTKRSSIEKELMSLSYQSIKPLRCGMMREGRGDDREVWEQGMCNMNGGGVIGLGGGLGVRLLMSAYRALTGCLYIRRRSVHHTTIITSPC